MKQLRAHNSEHEFNLHLNIVAVSRCTASSAEIKQICTHHKKKQKTKNLRTQLGICLLHQPNTNCTKIEIDIKIGDLTCLREYAESLALVKLKMYTCYVHDHHKNLTLSQLILLLFEYRSGCLYLYFLKIYFLVYWCFSTIKRGKIPTALVCSCSPNFHAFQTLTLDEIYIGQYILSLHYL